jgi:phosphatidylglycerophosphate synthase
VVLVRADAVLDQPVVAVLSRRINFVLTGEGSRGVMPVAAVVHGPAAAETARLLDHDVFGSTSARPSERGDPAVDAGGAASRRPGCAGRAPSLGSRLRGNERDVSPPFDPTKSRPAREASDATAALRDLEVRTPGELDAAFWKGLRKRETPYALLVDASNREAVEWRMFMGTYKGATDFVTKHLWPRLAFMTTRFLAPLGITPNMVTLAGAILMAAAFWLFLEGAYVSGLIAAWLMTFLDTVDGKLARTTLTSSKWGDVLDHGMDLVHPPFWYVAWGLGLEAAGRALPGAVLWTAIGVILGGYVLQRAMEGIAIKWLGLEIHIWRPIDTWFRQITARRNPNLALLTAATIVGRPDWGLIAVAAWTAICLVLHGVQLLQAFAVRRQNGPLRSWMEARAGLP